jgi:hypothetical protein
MARIPYGFHPQMNGFYPYGGFPNNTNIKPYIAGGMANRNRKPLPPKPKKPKV